MPNGTSPSLPPGWKPNTNVAEVIAEIKKRIDRIKELDAQFENIERERDFNRELISQLIKTGHA